MDENKGIRRNHPPAFRAKVAVEALKEQKTISQISSQFGVHSSLVTKWKAMAMSGLEQIFSGKKAISDRDQDELISQLYQQIGQLKVQIDWLKKRWAISNSDLSVSAKVSHIEKLPQLSIATQT